MYLFSRRAQLLQGNLQSAQHWAERVHEKVNQISGLQITTYQTMFSPHVGSIVFATSSPDLESLETTNDKLLADDGYLTLLDEGSQYLQEGTVHDSLIQVVYSAGQTQWGQFGTQQGQQGQQFQQQQPFTQQQQQQPYATPQGQQTTPTTPTFQQQQQPMQGGISQISQQQRQQQIQMWQNFQQQQQVGQYVSAVQAVCAAGSFVRGLEVGVQIASKVEQTTGHPVTFGTNITGPYGSIVWSTAYPNVQALEQSQQAILQNTELTQFIDNKAKGVFAENFDLTQQMILRRLRA